MILGKCRSRPVNLDVPPGYEARESFLIIFGRIVPDGVEINNAAIVQLFAEPAKEGPIRCAFVEEWFCEPAVTDVEELHQDIRSFMGGSEGSEHWSAVGTNKQQAQISLESWLELAKWRQ